MAHICANTSGWQEIGGIHITQFIDSDTTPDDFDRECERTSGYKLENGGLSGWNALGAAAHKGNIPLVEHIVKKGGEKLLELGNYYGLTPLACAIRGNNPDMVRRLLQLKADVNAGTTSWTSDSNYGDVPYGATPLYQAAHNAQNISICKLLLRHGGVAEPESELDRGAKNGSEVLSQATREVQEERKAIDEATQMPTVLIDIIDKHL